MLPLPMEVFEMRGQLVDAFRFLQSGKAIGKVVVRVEPPPDASPVRDGKGAVLVMGSGCGERWRRLFEGDSEGLRELPLGEPPAEPEVCTELSGVDEIDTQISQESLGNRENP